MEETAAERRDSETGEDKGRKEERSKTEEKQGATGERRLRKWSRWEDSQEGVIREEEKMKQRMFFVVH